MPDAKKSPLTPNEASRYLSEHHGLRRAPQTLAKMRSIGGGPQFRRAGSRILYAIDDLDAWAAKVISEPVRSTAEYIEHAA